MEKTFTVKNPTGLHARPAGALVKKASSFAGDITLKKGDKSVNAKSLMTVLALGLAAGSEITVAASGDNAEEAVAAIGEMLETVYD